MERAQQLRKTGVNSDAALEDAASALAASKSALAKIRAVLDQKSIEAPFAGTVGIPRIDVGQYVEPGTMIGTLQQLDTMRVDFTVPEQLLGEVSMGQPATFGLTEDDFSLSGPDRRRRSEDRPADATRLGPRDGEELRREPPSRAVRTRARRAARDQRCHRAAADGGGDEPLRRLRLRRRAGGCAG